MRPPVIRVVPGSSGHLLALAFGFSNPHWSARLWYWVCWAITTLRRKWGRPTQSFEKW